MSLDRLLATLSADAEAQIERAVTEARTEIAALSEATESRIAAKRAAARGARDSQRAAAVERGLGETRRHALAEVLNARAGLLERVFAAARARAEALVGRTRYRDELSHSVTEALQCLGDRGSATLRCSPALLHSVRLAAGNGKITVTPDADIGVGFRLSADDGTVDVDGTVEGQLAARATTLEQGVLRDLHEVR